MESVKSAALPRSILQLKVRLLGISPMIWRRVLVPASMTLRELHGVVQLAMGWEGIHLFEFVVRGARYAGPYLASSEGLYPEWLCCKIRPESVNCLRWLERGVGA